MGCPGPWCWPKPIWISSRGRSAFRSDPLEPTRPRGTGATARPFPPGAHHPLGSRGDHLATGGRPAEGAVAGPGQCRSGQRSSAPEDSGPGPVDAHRPAGAGRSLLAAACRNRRWPSSGRGRSPAAAGAAGPTLPAAPGAGLSPTPSHHRAAVDPGGRIQSLSELTLGRQTGCTALHGIGQQHEMVPHWGCPCTPNSLAPGFNRCGGSPC